MKKTTRTLTNAGTAVVLLGLCLLNPVLAAEMQQAGHVPLKSMNQAEYESYHEQLDRQVRNATKETPAQNSDAKEASADPQEGKDTDQSADKSNGSSYGKGYRARMQSGKASSGRAGGYRGGSGSMSRGGGGRYR